MQCNCSNCAPASITSTTRGIDIQPGRKYLECVESVARHGRTSEDPREVLAVLRTLAKPSNYLKCFADAAPMNVGGV
jgi:hypothetical protein